MSEEQWLSATEPNVMLRCLRNIGYAGDRRLRLFACACIRRVWYLLDDEASQRAVEVAEEYAEGQTSRKQLDHAKNSVWCPRKNSGPHIVSRKALLRRTLVEAACYAGTRGVSKAAADATRHVIWVAGTEFYRHATLNSNCDSRYQRTQREDAKAVECAAHVALLRCIFGNPFRPPPRLNASLLAWSDGTVRRIAQAIYDSRRFEDMPILADALEEAGCGDQEMLGHCREQEGVHARGCWVLDLLLQKE